MTNLDSRPSNWKFGPLKYVSIPYNKNKCTVEKTEIFGTGLLVNLKNELGCVSTVQKEYSRIYLTTFGRTTGLILGLFCLRGRQKVWGMRCWRLITAIELLTKIQYGIICNTVKQSQQLFNAWKANCKLRTNTSARTIFKIFIRLWRWKNFIIHRWYLVRKYISLQDTGDNHKTYKE